MVFTISPPLFLVCERVRFSDILQSRTESQVPRFMPQIGLVYQADAALLLVAACLHQLRVVASRPSLMHTSLCVMW